MCQERIKERERVTYASATVRAESKTTTINRTILTAACAWNVIPRDHSSIYSSGFGFCPYCSRQKLHALSLLCALDVYMYMYMYIMYIT